jgi:hypothetical protein
MSTVVVLAKNVLSTCKLFVANTLVVVTELDTTRFANGCVNPLPAMLDKRPPSP